MQAPGFEPELLAWKAKILTRLDYACTLGYLLMFVQAYLENMLSSNFQALPASWPPGDIELVNKKPSIKKNKNG